MDSTQEHNSVSRPVMIYIHQLCMDTGCRLKEWCLIAKDGESESMEVYEAAWLDDA